MHDVDIAQFVYLLLVLVLLLPGGIEVVRRWWRNRR
jgi:hypothetical protein